MTGAVVQRHRYDAFGHRVDVMDWQTPLLTPGQFGSFNSITNRGFTGHEHADAQGIIQTR